MNDKLQLLINTFGLTRAANKAGFILPDGTMLDLSNANRAHRIYHTETLNVIYGLPADGEEWTDHDLVALIGELSLIRFCYSGLIHTANKPTPMQLRQLYKMVAYRSNPFEVLLSHSTGISMGRQRIVSPTMKDLQKIFTVYDKSPLPFCIDEFLIEEQEQQLNLVFRPLQKTIGSYQHSTQDYSLNAAYSPVMPLFKEMAAEFI